MVSYRRWTTCQSQRRTNSGSTATKPTFELDFQEDGRGHSRSLRNTQSQSVSSALAFSLGIGLVTDDPRKYLYYLSVLHTFHDKTPKISSLPTSEVPGLFPGVPSQIVNGVLGRFTERSGKKYNVTDRCKTKLLAWMCVIYLTVDGWSTDIAKVATDLKQKPAKCVSPFEPPRLGNKDFRARLLTIQDPRDVPEFRMWHRYTRSGRT